MVIRKIGVGSAAKVFGTCTRSGPSSSASASRCSPSSAPAWRRPGKTHRGGWAVVFGVGAVVILPIVYGILGAIFGALTAALYNLVAGMAGGLRLDVE